MIQEDGGAAGAVGTTSAVPTVNTQSTGEAEIAANPPVFRKKKRKLEFGMIQRPNPVNPKPLRSIVGRDLANDRRSDKK